MHAPPTCAALLVELLEQFGVEVVFGIPGVHTMELYRGLGTSAIRHISPRHEQGAGFMADGYARVSGKPGVCFVISGPGVTNILTAMGQAYADSIPMLVISSVNRTSELGLGGGRLHELPSQRALTAGVSAFSHTVMKPEELPEVLQRAFALFACARPRPVHIEIPLDVMTAPAGQVVFKVAQIPPRPRPAAAAIGAAVQMLRCAQRPLVLLGGGAIDAADCVLSLVEALDAPTACTVNAKGLLPKGHPLSLGSNQSLPPVRELAAQSDVVLAIGTELGETDYDVVFDDGFRLTGKLIRIDIDPEQLQRNYPAALAILSDARAAVIALLEALGARHTPALDTPGRRRAAEVRRQLPAHWPPIWNGQRRMLELIQESLPGVIIVGDSTQPVYSGNFLYEAIQPRSWFNSSTGFGTLGYGLPAAIGAQLAALQRPVVALIGDGGIQFTLAELGSAVEAEAPIIILLWNNDGYGEIKRYMKRRGIPSLGVDLHTPDFLRIARAFGCKAARPASFAELRDLLIGAAAVPGPTLIEVLEEAAFLQT
jgi:acetolactate synthase I/II/III large subunit